MDSITYQSPIGTMDILAKEQKIVGIYFQGQMGYYAGNTQRDEDCQQVLIETKAWLDDYFSGHISNHMPEMAMEGTTFQQMVWNELQRIPYGRTTTYGQIAQAVGRQMGKTHMSAQAVGGAVGRNPISILVPCHRVIGAHGELTGYAGGIERKEYLLKMEQNQIKRRK